MKLEQIKQNMITMGNLVQNSLDKAVISLVERNSNGFQEVHQIEKKINEWHVKLDDECLSFLAMQSPVAKDLRLIFSIIKINADLERMGDQAVNIAYTGKDYLSRTPIAWPKEIAEMSLIAQKMLKDSLESFVTEDNDLAQKVLVLDNEVDQRKNTVFKNLMMDVQKKSDNVEAAFDIILIARNLERIGDHATNIAEDVIFITTGKDIRHGGKYSNVT